MANNRRYFEYVAVVIIAVIVAVAIGRFTAPSSDSSAAGNSTLDRVIKSGVLRVGASANGGLPYAARDANGNVIGFLPDVYAELAKAMGVKMEFVDTPDASRIPFMQAGKLDLTYGTITLTRAQALSFSNPLNVDGSSGAVLKSSGITSYAEAQGKKISTISGGSGEAIAAKIFPGNTNIIHVDGSGTALQALKSGQTDVDFDNYTYLSAAAKDDPTILALPAASFEPAGFMGLYGDMAWINYLNYFINDLWVSAQSTCGCGKELYIKWFKADPIPVIFNY